MTHYDGGDSGTERLDTQHKGQELRFTIIPPQDVNAVSAGQLAALHEKNFPDYYLTQLGTPLLTSFYLHFLSHPNNLCVIATGASGVDGLALFVDDYDTQMAAFYRKYWRSLVVGILRGFLRHPARVLVGTFKRVAGLFSHDSVIVPNLPRVTLLSIVVESSIRGKGLGRELVQTGTAALSARGVSTYYLSVVATNTAAIAFYEKIGLAIVSQTGRKVLMVGTTDED
ncbi:MAG: GNAT family N-acetyltransferase [Propionibacteriaceae bacterium]|nr:GNAT family N-acetyltransferase [Propionibacteriaceae bacterium]